MYYCTIWNQVRIPRIKILNCCQIGIIDSNFDIPKKIGTIFNNIIFSYRNKYKNSEFQLYFVVQMLAKDEENKAVLCEFQNKFTI